MICRTKIAERFIKTEYPEVKDLSEMFFTLVSAVFVASLAFWEKILFSAKPDSPAKFSPSEAWVALLLSIISCGVGLTLSEIAFDLAAWSPDNNFDKFASSSLFWPVLSGCLFVWGLVLFTFTSIWAIYHHGDT